MKFKIPGQDEATPGAQLMARSERRRLIFLITGFLIVSGVLISSVFQASKGRSTHSQTPLEDESLGVELPVALPPLDLARLESMVHDAEAGDRVVLESEAADLLMETALRWTPRHYEVEQAPELDRERIAELAANPAQARGRPFTVRGSIAALRPRSGAARGQQELGKLELQDGSTAYFLTSEVPENARELGGFVRLDGLFLKLYSTEDELEPGRWIEGPLLVGARAIPSYPASGPVTELSGRILSEVEDARLSSDDGQAPRLVLETPAEPFWHLMAYARDAGPELDWSQAPVLDQRLLDQILEHPEDFRARPFLLPISRLQDGRVRLAGENPARMERYTQGWIGNTTWKNVIHFRSPVLRPDLHIGDLVFGRGFFLHTFAYESSERGLRVAPVFVLESLEHHVPEKSLVLTRIPWLVAGIAGVLALLFFFLTRRDRLRTSQFQEELVRRRRARRGRKSAGAGTASP